MLASSVTPLSSMRVYSNHETRLNARESLRNDLIGGENGVSIRLDAIRSADDLNKVRFLQLMRIIIEMMTMSSGYKPETD